MRLAIYCPDFFPSVSGYSFAFQDLVRGLCGEGVEVDVFTPIALGVAEELTLPGLRIVRIQHTEPLSAVKYVRGLWNVLIKPRQTAAVIARAHEERQYDALLSETLEDPLVLLNLPPTLRARTVIRIHGCAETEQAMWDPSPLWRFKRRLIQRVLKRDIRFITATADYYLGFARQWFLENDALLIADKRFAVIPNSAPRLADSPRRPDDKEGRRHFMTLGRMNWVGANQKGFDDVLMALQEMSADQRARIRLTIVGQGTEQPRLKRIAESIPDVRIDFVDGLPNAGVRELLRNVDGVVLASRYEGMSVFALEAVGSGAPVVFSDAGGIAALVQGNGRRFFASDPRSLAAAWGGLLVATPDEMYEMSRASLDLAAGLTPDRAAQALVRFLNVARSQTQGQSAG